MNRFCGKSKYNSSPAVLRCLYLIATVIGAGTLITYLNKNLDIIRLNKKLNISPWNNDEYEAHSFEEKFTIDTEGCSIPALKPLDDTINQYIEHSKPKPCRSSSFVLLDNNRTHIWIKQNVKMHFNATDQNKLICCYKPFYRPASIDDISSIKVDDRVQYKKCTLFAKEIKVSDEFVKVECINRGKIVYEQFFLFTLKKKMSWHHAKKVYKSKPEYNILVLGIDAVSRLNFHRTMPKTLQFLKNKGAIELLGYNKVGDNTFPNVISMLLGIKENEMRKTCLPNQWSNFDNCPFVWELFKQSGFYTAFAEDSSSLGTFNYQRSGFVGTPTDYYIHTFINEAERKAGYNKDLNSFLCVNEKYFYDVLLRYVEDLIATLKGTKLFGFFWEVTMSHDYLNYPIVMDKNYEKFLERLEASQYLDETILFLTSDHGLRWGKLRSTKQGRLEERLPFMYILVPQSFRNNYLEAYTNLKINSRRLTTPFDIHATLCDLTDLNNIKNKQIQDRKMRSYSRNRSISLFLPIFRNRTCQLAGIDDHWCTCHKNYKLSLKSLEATSAASQLLRLLNQLLNDYPQCASLKLAELLEVSELEVGTPDRNEIGWREFLVVIRTEPGGGVFEATLRHDNQDWILAGTISRLNLYGTQSRCIYNYHLKLYCFCIT